MTDSERLWSRVAIGEPDDCWPWTGSTFKFGHGRFAHEGKGKQAHRLAWFFTYGEMPSLCVCHRCDNPKCCNPAHLFLGTHAENMQDRNRKGRTARGERNRHAKLSSPQVLDIRRKVKTGATQRSTAKEYGVSIALVSFIVNRKIWTHLEIEA